MRKDRTSFKFWAYIPGNSTVNLNEIRKKTRIYYEFEKVNNTL